ncbi:MAG TPA: hypothetical protein VFS15_27600, partial [Kofleriaceae bacterium]|nr:hypothetical protein [Kofleriaceae bacterium]
MWWSYYAFWLLVPTAIALVSAHPSVLVIVAVALVARRWLPDPVLYLRHASRVRSLQQQVELNPANATARAQLAEIWLAKRRARRAIPLLQQALEARRVDLDEPLVRLDRLVTTADLGERVANREVRAAVADLLVLR